jgi:hypothetical protein
MAWNAVTKRVSLAVARVYDPCVEPERFDDVGFEFLAVPDTVRPRRRHGRRVAALGVLTGSAVALVAAAALAVTPAHAPTQHPRTAAPASYFGVGVPEFHDAAAPGRGGHPGANCHHGAFHPSGRSASDASNF